MPLDRQVVEVVLALGTLVSAVVSDVAPAPISPGVAFTAALGLDAVRRVAEVPVHAAFAALAVGIKFLVSSIYLVPFLVAARPLALLVAAFLGHPRPADGRVEAAAARVAVPMVHSPAAPGVGAAHVPSAATRVRAVGRAAGDTPGLALGPALDMALWLAWRPSAAAQAAMVGGLASRVFLGRAVPSPLRLGDLVTYSSFLVFFYRLKLEWLDRHFY